MRSLRQSLSPDSAGWAWTAELAGAVIAPGVVVVELEVKQVQHPTGGVVSELNVRNDDYVKAGDVVVRLDATQTQGQRGGVQQKSRRAPIKASSA